MNTYRKSYSKNLTFVSGGVIDTPRNSVEGSSFVAQAKLFLLNVSLIAAVVAIVARLGGLI